jgi:hypothetical protein
MSELNANGPRAIYIAFDQISLSVELSQLNPLPMACAMHRRRPMNDPTPASQLLDRYPGMRDRVVAMPEFLQWRALMPTVVVDGELFYVVGGDQLKDHDQIVVAWLNQYHSDFLGDRLNVASKLE